MKLSEIKAVKHSDSDIVKIVSGGVLLWEKEKVLKTKWIKQSDSYSSVSGFSPEGFYRDYEIRDGKFYGVGDKNNYFGYGTYYVLDDGADTIKKLVYTKSTYTGPAYDQKETFYFDVYIGTCASEYI